MWYAVNIYQKEYICQAHTCNISYLEAKIGRIAIQGQSRQIVLKTPFPKITRKNGLEVWLKL
jgi:hypothetical protein